MQSSMLMVSAISQNFAVFFCALFAGGSVYISLVEDPATAKGGAEMAGAYLLTAHPRPTVLQTFFAALASASGYAKAVAAGSHWWFAASTLLALAAFMQLYKVLPLVRAVADAGSEADPHWLGARLKAVAQLHALLTLAGLIALFTFVMKA